MLPLSFGFKDPTQTKFGRANLFKYKNGYRMAENVELGGDHAPMEQLEQIARSEPKLSSGDPRTKTAPREPFIPSYVAYDKKTLTFRGFFKQTVHESPLETYRVRPVNIFYFLEDDTLCVIEPPVQNAGFLQGKLLRRQRVPKNDHGEPYHWKDLNVGMDLTLYGTVYRLTDCDPFTKTFLESEGICVREPETIPEDPYISSKRDTVSQMLHREEKKPDTLGQFLQNDKKVLRFYAVWDEREQEHGELRPYVIHYFLADDTIEVREVHKPNEGRDPFPLLLRRQKVPKYMASSVLTFPSITLEVSDTEVDKWVTSRDLRIGATVCIFNRRFLIYDCDEFTKAYLAQKYHLTDFTPIDVSRKAQGVDDDCYPLPSKSQMEPLVLKAPVKDYVKNLELHGKILRFCAVLENSGGDICRQIPERRFVVTYFPSDETMAIYEPPVRNSGFRGGRFLERRRVEKPGSTSELPDYYTIKDLYIGAVLIVYSRRFKIIGADRYVLTYMEENPFDLGANIASLRQHFGIFEPPVEINKDTSNIDVVVCEEGHGEEEEVTAGAQERPTLEEKPITNERKNETTDLGLQAKETCERIKERQLLPNTEKRRVRFGEDAHRPV